MPATLRLVNTTRDTTVAGRVTSGDSFVARFLGLMGKASLGPDEGLWLPRTGSIHMFFMRFAIDCAFLGPAGPDGQRRVVAVRHGLPPWRGIVWYTRGSDSVVELAAGTLSRSGTEVGDSVRLEAT